MAAKLVGLAVLGCGVAMLLRAYKPALALPFVLAAGTALLLWAWGSLTGVLETLRAAFARFGLEMRYVETALKVIGVAYLAQFAANLCRDAGESALAGKVELCGRVLILSASAPVILGILDVLEGFAKLS